MSASPAPPGLATILSALSRAGVDFVVCGGVACIAHGVARTTADLDCCVRLEDGNLRRLIDALKPMGFRLRAPEPIDALADPARRAAWIAEKGAQVATLTHEGSPLQVDLFLRYAVPYDELQRDAVRMQVAGVAVSVSSRAHLCAAKQAVSPPRRVDLRDIEDLEELDRRERQ